MLGSIILSQVELHTYTKLFRIIIVDE